LDNHIHYFQQTSSTCGVQRGIPVVVSMIHMTPGIDQNSCDCQILYEKQRILMEHRALLDLYTICDQEFHHVDLIVLDGNDQRSLPSAALNVYRRTSFDKKLGACDEAGLGTKMQWRPILRIKETSQSCLFTSAWNSSRALTIVRFFLRHAKWIGNLCNQDELENQ
jgi:hypothetical protein